MKLRKRLAVSTLAATLVAGTFAGIPFSNKGLAEKLGFSNVAYAADTIGNSPLANRARALHEALVKVDGIAAMQALRTAVGNVKDTNLVTDIVDQINSRFPLDKLSTEEVNTLIRVLKTVSTMTYDPSFTELEQLRTDSKVQDLLRKLDPDNQLTIDAIATFVIGDSTHLGIEGEALAAIQRMSLDQKLNLIGNSSANQQARKDFVESVLTKVIKDPAYAVSKVLSTYGIDAPMVNSFVFRLQTAVDDTAGPAVVRNAAFKLAQAYFLMANVNTTPPITPGTPSFLLNIATPPNIDDALKAIDEIAKKLQGASAKEKAKLLEEAIAKAQEALDKAVIDLSKSLQINGDTAKATLNLDIVKKQIADLKKAAEQLKSKLKEIGADPALLSLTLKFNLGQTGTAAGELTIPKDILTETQNAGIATATVIINGVTVLIPIGELGADMTLSVKKLNDPIVTSQTKVSDLIDFNLWVGGQAVTTFKQSIIIRVPVTVPLNVDKELLSMAKIVNGKLVFVGGHLEGAEMVESRDTLSPYVVVENKVTFNDIGSVQSWAGRSIQVLAAKGAIVGKSEGLFAPRDGVTRAEFVKMLISALDLEDSSATESFTDVNASDWYTPYVAAAVKLGIVHGRSADRFAPQATITRAEMTAMIVHALEVTKKLKNDVTDVDAALKVFSDASKIHVTLKASVALAASKGLVSGYAGKFDPNGKATRAQAAVVLHHLLNFKK